MDEQLQMIFLLKLGWLQLCLQCFCLFTRKWDECFGKGLLILFPGFRVPFLFLKNLSLACLFHSLCHPWFGFLLLWVILCKVLIQSSWAENILFSIYPNEIDILNQQLIFSSLILYLWPILYYISLSLSPGWAVLGVEGMVLC